MFWLNLVRWRRPFSRAIRNLALRAPKPADAGGLLINRRSLRTSNNRLIHASMISRLPDVLAELIKKFDGLGKMMYNPFEALKDSKVQNGAGDFGNVPVTKILGCIDFRRVQVWQ